MQEYTSPGAVEIDPTETVTTGLWKAEREHPNRSALSYRKGDDFVDVSTSDFAATVRRLAAGFIAEGIEPGSRICLFAPTRVEFTYFDYAIWAAGCVTVTIYETSSPEQVEWIVKDSGATAIVCADDDLAKVFHERAGELGTCEKVYIIDSGAIEQLTAAGKDVTDDQVMDRVAMVDQGDLATLVYTSGTTGLPKGCHLTHRNFVSVIHNTVSETQNVFKAGGSTLMFLPLAHIFARLVQCGSVNEGVKLAYSTGIPALLEELAMVKPTFLFSVPRVFEKVYNGAVKKAEDDGKGAIFAKAADTAIEYARQTQEGSVSFKTRVLHTVFDKLVYSKLRERLGGRAEYAISGGAALGERLGYFFSGVGITVLEGYGLTETSAASTVNRPGKIKVGTVGKPIPGVSIGIADDGEVLIKGPHIFSGYWNRPDATAEVIDPEGWFHSGDIGNLDDEGYLRITGRKKELIVTAGGKNVAPAVLEDRLRAHALISQCMVVGDGKPFIAALITIDPDEFPRWASHHAKTAPLADLVDDEDLRASVREAIEQANLAVSKAEAIKEFRILPNDFTIEGGEMTPTMKVKRAVVADKYAAVLSSIYG